MTVMMERPRTIEPTDSARFDELCRMLERVDMFDGWRAEIIWGDIVLSPWSKGSYLPVMDSLADQIRAHAPEGHRVSPAPCLYVFPGQTRAYGPDLHVADAEATNIPTTQLPGEALSLVAELTSDSTAAFDRSDKVERYGMAGVPVYVLVDMLVASVTVYSSPGENGYRQQNQIKFGEQVHIPAPFNCELDTADWKS